MTKVYRVRGAGVDSGILAVFDTDSLGSGYKSEAQQTKERYKRLGLTYPRSSTKQDLVPFKIPKGVYLLSYKLLNNNPGLKNSGRGTLRVTSGTVLAGDPWYIASDTFVGDMGNLRGVVYIEDTGGDGTFDFDFTLKKK